MGTMKNTEGGLIILIHENIFQSSKNVYVQNLSRSHNESWRLFRKCSLEEDEIKLSDSFYLQCRKIDEMF